jgi:hypothetical protein
MAMPNSRADCARVCPNTQVVLGCFVLEASTVSNMIFNFSAEVGSFREVGIAKKMRLKKKVDFSIINLEKRLLYLL